MTTIPGTRFTKEELFAGLENDNITTEEYSNFNKPARCGWIYFKRMQYSKAVAWCFLSASQGNLYAQSSIAELYQHGAGLPLNSLCALKWYLKVAKEDIQASSPKNVGEMFEYGQGILVDNYKALEWYDYSGEKGDVIRLKTQGFHLSETDKKKPLSQLIKETESLVEIEKEKLEKKQNKTQDEIETIEHLKITYKLVESGNDKWRDIPIIASEDRSAISYKNEILQLNGRIQQLELEYIVSGDQSQQIQLLAQEKSKLELEMNEKNKNVSSLESEIQGLKFSKLQSEVHANTKIEQLNTTIATLEQSLKSKNTTVEVSHGTSEMVQILNRLLESKSNEIELLKQNTAHQLEKEKKKNDILKRKIKLLMQGKNPQQTAVQSTVPFSDITSFSNVISGHGNLSDDPDNDINYDSEFDDTEESDGDDINYDSPSEDEDTRNDPNYDSDSDSDN